VELPYIRYKMDKKMIPTAILIMLIVLSFRSYIHIFFSSRNTRMLCSLTDSICSLSVTMSKRKKNIRGCYSVGSFFKNLYI
jgi:hypothetical protein